MAKNKAPELRSMGSEMGTIIPMLGQLVKDQMSAYVGGQKSLYKFQMGRLPEDYPVMMGLQRTEAAKDRSSWIDFLRGHGAEALEALYASSPDLEDRLGQIDALADATGRTPEITRMLDDQAIADLQLGGMLSDEERRKAVQAARAGYSARGMAMGNPAILAEVLNEEDMSRGRLAERRAFAASREAGNRQFVQSATQIADAANPAMRILGIPTGAAQGMGNMMGFIQGVNTPDPGALMGAGLGYASDLYNTNFNALESRFLGDQNYNLAMKLGGMQVGASNYAANKGMQGQIAGAGIAAGGAIIGAGVGAVAF